MTDKEAKLKIKRINNHLQDLVDSGYILSINEFNKCIYVNSEQSIR